MTKKISLVISVLTVLIISSCKKETETVDCSTVTYSSKIKVIIDSKCATSGCHDASSVNGDFRSYAGLSPVLLNGKFKNEVITKKTMPKGGTLSTTQIEEINCWLNAGALEN